jgi:hypothetical protein
MGFFLKNKEKKRGVAGGGRRRQTREHVQVLGNGYSHE